MNSRGEWIQKGNEFTRGMHKHPVAHWAVCNRLNMFIEKIELKNLKKSGEIQEGMDYGGG